LNNRCAVLQNFIIKEATQMNLKLNTSDPILSKISSQIDPPVIHSTANVFHDLMSCIVEQQIHYRSTKRIFSKALERAGITLLTSDNFYLFEKHSLPQLKLRMDKYKTMLLFTEYWNTNTLDFNQLSDEEVIAELSAIKGIGKWTIDMILLYTLNRPDVFPYDDFHLKKSMISLYKLNPEAKLKAQMIEVSQAWMNQKSLAVLYLLAWKKQNKAM
jgi:DNA-3-methyladenine glycosylase II